MTPEEYRKAMDFESALKAGDRVRVSWTNCGNFFGAIAEVVRVNAKSVVVKLREEVSYPGLASGYPVGQRIRAPRLGDIRRWSVNNRVEPIGGYT